MAEPAALHLRAIPHSGEQLPLIGPGTWQTFDVGPDPTQRAARGEVLQAFADGGGRLVDSSPMYGHAEAVVGEQSAARGLRPRLFLATKVWTTGREAGVRQLEASFRKLRSDVLDLVQVHNLVDVDTHLAMLREWQRAGRIRYVGITHYTAAAHDAVERVLRAQRVDFLQINYSVRERHAERRLLPLARERGVAVIANRPFAEGDLLRRLARRPLPPVAAELACATWAQLLLKFVVGHPAVTCAIPATADVAHVRDNLDSGRGPLPDERQRASIADAADGAHRSG